MGPAFPEVWFHKGVRWQRLEGNNRLWETKGTWIQDCIWAEWGKYLLAPAQAVHQGQSESVYCQHELKACLGPRLFSHFPTTGQRSWCVRGKSTLLKGKEPARAQAFRGSAPATWGQNPLPIRRWQSWAEGNPTSYPAPASVSPSSTKVMAVCTSQGKKWHVSMSNPVLPSKNSSTCNPYRDIPTEWHSHKTTKANCFI